MPYINIASMLTERSLKDMTEDATASNNQILVNETAYVNGEKNN